MTHYFVISSLWQINNILEEYSIYYSSKKFIPLIYLYELNENAVH